VADDRVQLLGSLWDQNLIDELYGNALCYWHGHSVGGTNPSLLRAAGAGTFTAAYDVSFNREVLGRWGDFFSTEADVAELASAIEADPERAADRGRSLQQSIRRYNWDDVASGYEALCRRLANRDFPRDRPSGRRSGAWDGGSTSARATAGTASTRVTSSA
jgi:glycosyltransferase involved in cell wall biosynthesis